MSVIVHDRDDWTTRPGAGCSLMPASGVRGVVYHWPGTPGTLIGLTLAQVTSRLRGWQDYHMDGRGYCDIAYQWAAADIGGQAHVFPLRTFDRKSAAQDNPNLAGAENDEWYAVLAVFGIADNTVTPALVEGMRWCRGKALGRTPGATRVAPHSVFGDTDCPGDVLRAALPRVAEDVPPPTEEEGLSAEEVKAINDHTSEQLLRLGGWLTQGRANRLFNPTTQPWVNEPTTVTLDKVVAPEVLGINARRQFTPRLDDGTPDTPDGQLITEMTLGQLAEIAAVNATLGHTVDAPAAARALTLLAEAIAALVPPSPGN